MDVEVGVVLGEWGLRPVALDVDVLLKLRRDDLIFGEVPLILRYDLKEGASKMRVARTAAGTLALMLRRRLGG